MNKFMGWNLMQNKLPFLERHSDYTMSEFTRKKPLPAIPNGKVLGPGEATNAGVETDLGKNMESMDITDNTSIGSKKGKTSRLRGRLETAKQVDVNFSEETEGNALELDEEDYESLRALSSFMNIPALRLGIVKPTVSEHGDKAKDVDR